MRPRLRLLVFAALVLAPSIGAQSPPPPSLRLSEIVTDPQQDWSGDGRVGATDEYIELENAGPQAVDLSGWRLWLNDTTPTTADLAGLVEPHTHWVLLNPPGDLNNNAHVALRDPAGRWVDEVRFGSWTGNEFGVPSADAHGRLDEGLVRIGATWRQSHVTPGRPNGEVQLRSSDGWERMGEGAWVGPDSVANLSATALHATERFEAVRLRTRNATGENVAGAISGSPVHEIHASFPVSSGRTPFAYRWEAATASGLTEGPWMAVRVDAEPPLLPSFPTEIFVGDGERARLHLPSAVDKGAGGSQIQLLTYVEGVTTVSDWGDSALVDASEWPEGRGAQFEICARDRFNNSACSPRVEVVVDRTPPPELRDVQVTGAGPYSLRWTATSEADAAGIEMRRRIGPAVSTWNLSANAVEFQDHPEPGRSELSYEVLVHDHAGNRGPARRFEIDHPGLRPRLLGTRILHPVLTGATQELRFDFDRKMNATAPVEARLTGPISADLQGRLFANRSTFLIEADDLGRAPDGTYTVTLANAVDENGRPPQTSPSATFRIDRTPPNLTADLSSGWTSRDSLRLLATDNGPGRVLLTWTLTPAADDTPAQEGRAEGSANVSIPTAGRWTLRAAATDEAGIRTPTMRIDLRVDRTPPRVRIEAPQGTSPASLAVEDDESGVDWRSLTLDGSIAGATPKNGKLPLHGGSTQLSGSIADHAGNRQAFAYTAPSPSSSVPPSEDPAAGTTKAHIGDRAAPGALAALRDRPVAATAAAPEPWLPWAISLVGVVGVAVPIVRRRRRRKSRPRPSLARRLRALRSQAPTP